MAEAALQAYQYTGPLFAKWNGVLRYMPLESADLTRHRNLYPTSIQVLTSATIKLSRITKVPPGRKSFRGMGKLVLGREWFESDDRGVRSGVELGFLSTTLNQHIAMDYSGIKNGTGTVLELDIGAINCGARLDMLSQYPAEVELLYPLLSHLELVGEPTVQLYDWQGKQQQVLVIRVKITVNQKNMTVEEVLSQRKQIVLDIGGGSRRSFSSISGCCPRCNGPRVLNRLLRLLAICRLNRLLRLEPAWSRRAFRTGETCSRRV